MKKKWINLKRRWRKMHKSDRSYFACMGTLAALNIATLPWAHGNVMNILWLSLLLWMRWQYVAALRIETKWNLRRGGIRQWRSDRKRYNELVDRYLDMSNERNNLHSKYKKLEYDYRQLKKQVKSNDKKK